MVEPAYTSSGRVNNQQRVFWWLEKEVGSALEALTNDFSNLVSDSQRLEAYETYSSLYTNRRVNPGGPLVGTSEANWLVSRGKYTRVPYNLMKQIVDEVVSRVVKSTPRARFLTHGGNRALQKKAKLMERWNDAQVHQLQEAELFDHIVLDACLYGMGCLKFYMAQREDKVRCERVYAGNLFVDLEETVFSTPRRLHHRRFVSKRVLMQLFPKHADAIEASDSVSDHADRNSFYHHQSSPNDTIEVIESWHLPTYLDKDDKSPDGIRYLWIEKAVLQKSAYNRRQFPFSFFVWKQDPHNRFYGIGLAEDLLGVHIDANITLRRVNKAIEFVPNPYVLVRTGTKVQASDITNAPGTIIEYAGGDPPQIVMPPSVPGDLLSYVQEHEIRARKIAGLSAMGSGERIPSGLETGRAVENYFQVESVPFSQQLKKFENFVQSVAENNVAVGREIYGRNPTFTVVLPEDRYTIEELKWEEVSIDPRQDAYVIRAAPTSALSETPSARLQEVERLAMMFPNMPEATKRDLLSMPDLEKENDLATAAQKNIDAMIDAALDEGTFMPPSQFMDLDLFIIRANAAEQRGHDMGVPEKHLAELRRMILRANELRQQQLLAAAANQQGMITPTAVPQGPEGQARTAIQE